MNGAVIVGGVVIVAGSAAAAAIEPSKVRFIQHADGAHPALRALLAEWARIGTHEVQVAPGATSWPYPGGLRTDASAQQAAADAGLSGARTLQQTAHGRGGALDVWPMGFDPFRGFDARGQLGGAEMLFRLFGEWAEKQTVQLGGEYFTFTWGGRFGKPDLPHVEITGWTRLPFPPPDYGRGFV